MKPTNVKPGTYIKYGVEHNDKDPKFKVGDHVRISKYKNIFTTGYTPNWSEEVFISDLNGEEIVWKFYVKELQKTAKKVRDWNINQKVIDCMANGKAMIIFSKAELKWKT